MKRKLICCLMAAAMLIALVGCAEQPIQADTQANPTNTQQDGAQAGASGSASPQASGELEDIHMTPGPQGTTVTGEGKGMAEETEFSYSERYEADGYSFRYPVGSTILEDTETQKIFQFGDGYVLNVTRLNLSGQDITFDKTLLVYRKTLETLGSTVESVEQIGGFAFGDPLYENALLALKLNSGEELTEAAQVFFLADEYNYTFTVSKRDGNMEELKKIVSDIIRTFSIT